MTLKTSGAIANLRIVGLAGQRDVEIDLSVAVLQQRHGELDRQVGGVGAVVAGPEGEVVDQELVLGLELLLVDVVVEPHRELALVQRDARRTSPGKCVKAVRSVFVNATARSSCRSLASGLTLPEMAERRGGVHLAAADPPWPCSAPATTSP